MPLPTCKCVEHYTEGSKLDAIYCALLAIAEAGGGITLPLAPSEGGTGVANNDASTITITGAFALGITLTAPTALIFPTAGTLATTAIVGGGTNATTPVGIHNNSHTEGASIASAATVNLDAATGYFLHITGNNVINAFTLAQGNFRVLIFDGTPILTNGANLLNPTAANIAVDANDMAIAVGEGGGVTRIISYQRKSGTALVGLNPFDQNLNSVDSVTFGDASIGGNVIDVNGFNGLAITGNGTTLDLSAVAAALTVTTGWTLMNTAADNTTFDSDAGAAPGTGALGSPTLAFGTPASGLLAEPTRWLTVTVNGTPYAIPAY